ncbi:hypothetical protein [Parasphingopyxis sp.]|uniref:hypothetical protein n=1 Tax=Parasphingopyxis sp. TaxID=1920299 RepID=UPI0026391804|nr:hypothetical protein [Parasphingopyxis sp.]
MTPDRIGGLAALFNAAAYLFGFAIFFAVLDRSGYEGLAGNLAFALDNQAVMALAMVALYLAFGVALTILVVTLHRYLARGSGTELTMQIASAFGLIWAGLVLASGMTGLVGLQTVASVATNDPDAAATIWSAVGIVQSALGGGIELVGGLWMVLISIVGLQTGLLPRWLNWPGIVVAVAGIATFVPGLGDLAALFGLGQILWFAMLGMLMLRRPVAVPQH